MADVDGLGLSALASPRRSRAQPKKAAPAPGKQAPRRGNPRRGRLQPLSEEARRKRDEENRLREEQELALERERASAADEDERARVVARALGAYSAAHGAAGSAILRVHDAASRVAALRASVSSAELVRLRSPAARKVLKADMKKGTGLSKRVAGMTEETAGAVLKDVATYALGRYAGEIAVALGSDAGLRASDMEHAVGVAAAMHARYAEFTPVLMSTLLCAAGRAVEVAAAGEELGSGGGSSSGAAPQASGSASATPAPAASSSAPAAAAKKGPTALSAALKPLHTALTAARARVSQAVGDFGASEGDPGGVTPAAITSAAIGSVDAKDTKAAAARLRTLLRFALELASAGVYADSEAVVAIATSLFGESGKEAAAIVKEAAGKGAAAAGSSTIEVPSANPFAAAATPSFATPMPEGSAAGRTGTAAAAAAPAPAPAPAPLSVDTLLAPAVAEDVAFRSSLLLPLVASVYRVHGEAMTGRPMRKSRTWLAASPRMGPYGECVTDPVKRWAAASPRLEVEVAEWLREDAPAAKPKAAAVSSAASISPIAWPYAQSWLDAHAALPCPASLTVPLGGPTHAYEILARGAEDALSGTATASWLASHSMVRLRPPSRAQLLLPCPFLSRDAQASLARTADRYFDALSTALLNEVRAVLELEARARVAQFAKGGLGDALEARLVARRSGLERLLEGTRAMAEMLDRDLPPLPTEVTLEDEDGDDGPRMRVLTGTGIAGHGPFDDPAEAAFYRSFPSMETAPRVLLDPEGLYASPSDSAAEVKAKAAAAAAGAATAAAAAADALAAAAAAAAAAATATAGAPAPAVVPAASREANPRDRHRGNLDSALQQLTSIPTAGGKPAAGGRPGGAGAEGGPTPAGAEGEGAAGGEEEGDAIGGAKGSSGAGVGAGLGEYLSSSDVREMLAESGLGEGLESAAASAAPAPTGSFKPLTTSEGDSVTFSSLLDRLARLGSPDDADTWAHDFIFGQLNSRPARSRLLRTLFALGRAPAAGATARRVTLVTDSLPFVARLVAVLDTGLHEPARLAPALGTLLEEEFRLAMNRGGGGGGPVRGLKGGDRVTTAAVLPTDVRCRAVRLLGELVKFGALPPAGLFRCAKWCVDEGSLSSLSVLALLVDTSGRHLYLRPDTRDTVTRMMEALRRIKEGTQVTGQQAVKGLTAPAKAPAVAGPAPKALTGPAADLIESMLFTIMPPERPTSTVVLDPPLEAFIAHAMLERPLAGAEDVDDLLKLLRKLPWSSPPGSTSTTPAGLVFACSGDVVEATVVRCILSASRLDGSRVETLMSVLAGLRVYHDRVAVRVVDGAVVRILSAVEEATSGKDAPVSTGALHSRARQPSRVLGAVRILGHAYNYKLCDGPTLIHVLFTVLNTGHAVPRAQLEAGLEAANAQLAARAAARAAGAPRVDAKAALKAEEEEEVEEEEGETPEAKYAREVGAATTAALDRVLDASAEEIARSAGTEAAIAAAAPRIAMPPVDPSSGGWGFHPLVPSSSDPAGDTLRVRIVTAVLEVSGEFFSRGAAAVRMDRFLTYFLRYLACRGPFPMDTTFAVADAIEAVRPSLRTPGAGSRALSRVDAEIGAAKLELDELARAAIDDVTARVEAARRVAAASSASGGVTALPAVTVLAPADEEEDEDEEEGDEEEGDEEEGEEGDGEGEEGATAGAEEDGGAVQESDSESEEEEEEDEETADETQAPAAPASGPGQAAGGEGSEEEDEDDGFDDAFASFVREQADGARRNAQGGAMPMRLGAAPVPSAAAKATAAAAASETAPANGAPVVQFALLTRGKGSGAGSGARPATSLLVPSTEAWVQQAAAAAAVEAAARDEHRRATLRLVQEQAYAEERGNSRRWQ